jgi:putative ABC transport system permease protein
VNADLIVPSAFSLSVAALLVLASVGLLVLHRVRLWSDLLVAALRCTLQLLAVGFVLGEVFALRNLLAILGVLAVMLVVAAWTVGSRIRQRGPWLRLQVGVALLAGTTLSLLVGAQGALGVEPWYEPRYLIPLFGMLLGNSLNAATLGVDRLDAELRNRRAQVETLLTLGATWRQASVEMTRASLTAALLPAVNAMAVAGVVALPGMMTGQILSGTPPMVAVRYQILIWFLIVGTAVTAATILVHLRLRWHFTPAHQLIDRGGQ